jgi:thioredoxin reductase (NADPH)
VVRRRLATRSGVGHTGPVPAARPLILAVDDDPSARDLLRDELTTRYERDYEVRVTGTESCPSELETLENDGGRLALLLVANGPEADTLLGRARSLQPQARRALLLAPTNTRELTSAPAAITRGLADLVVIKPYRQPDEAFHRTVTEALHDWRRWEPIGPVAVRVVGERWSARSQSIRDRLDRNGVSYTFHAADSADGAAILDELGLDAGRLPVFVLFDGQVLVQPEDAEVADHMTAPAPSTDRLFDVAIVGAGPAGLAAAVYASSEGLETLVLEQEAVGGQAGTSSLIRNYLGFPHGIPGRDLALRAAQQAWLFGASFHWMRSATSLGRAEGAHTITLSDGTVVHTRSVIVATGVSWRRLDVPRMDELIGAGVSYGAAVSEAPMAEGQHVHVVGGGNSAGQAALHLARYAASVTLIVRGSSLAASMSEYLTRELTGTSNISIRFHTQVVGIGGDRRLDTVALEDAASGATVLEPSDGLFVLIGGEPRTGWLDGAVERDPGGYILTGRDVTTRAASGATGASFPLETSRPGVFAAGDVRRGSIKRVASAVGEGAIAIHACHQYLAG